MEKQEEVNQIGIYPNPVINDKITFSLENKEKFDVKIYNQIGQEMQSFLDIKTGMSIAFNYAPGIYYLKIIQGNQVIANKTVVKL